jgi:tetratricopeptide (TPR) repeat protein
LSDRGKYEEADAIYKESIEVFTAAKVPGDAQAWSITGLGVMSYSMGRFADAERLAREAVQIRQAVKVEDGPGYAMSKELLARVLCESGPSSEGEQHARDALMARQKATPREPRDVAIAESILGRCLAAAKRFDEAEQLLLGAHAQLIDERRPGRDRQYTARALADLYTAWPKPELAATWRSRK